MVVRKPEVLQAFLEDERDRLETVIDQIDAEGGKNLGYGNHMADDASEAFEQAKDLALRQNAEQLLTQVTHALDRFEQGTYGCLRAVQSPRSIRHGSKHCRTRRCAFTASND